MSMKHLLLLLSLLAISFPCFADDAAQLVYDTENHEVTSDASYYVLPAEHGTGGGGLDVVGSSCRHLVSQSRREDDIGKPVRFGVPNDLSGGKILLSSNVTISFDFASICVQPMYWSVSTGRVAAGKDEGACYPVPMTPEFVFSIEKHGNTTNGYKLVSCAREGHPCKDLGLYASEEETWLATSDTPFVVMFKKGKPM